MLYSHDDVPKITEHAALLWLAEEICDHLAGGAIHEVEFVLVDSVFDEKVPNVDVS